MSFTWAGRQLTTATVNGKTYSYTYNSDGIRTSKTVDGTLTDYLVDGSTIVAQNTAYDTLWFMYDRDGTRVGFTYNDDAYYYMKNAQGDVTGIVDSNLNVVVEYSYDAWGKLIDTTGSEANFIGKLNPFLYRGYYYDAETGLYYLGSRHYDPVLGRFLNADEQVGANQDILAYNLYAYCSNDPIIFKDFGGQYKVLSGNRVQVEKGDTLWEISEVLTGKGTNWVFFGYNGNLSKLQIGHIFNASSLPTAGKPNSKETLYNPDSTPKQERFYGPDGKPVRDRDYNHGGQHEFPHDHLWKTEEEARQFLFQSQHHHLQIYGWVLESGLERLELDIEFTEEFE